MNENFSELIGLRVKPSIARRIEALAEIEGLSKACWTRRLILRELAEIDRAAEREAA